MSSKETQSTMCTDRTGLFPSHKGYNVFPNSSLFGHLFRHAARKRNAIRDLRLGIERDYEQLLSDVLALRKKLKDSLDLPTIHSLERREEVYIGILSGGGYEFSVAILAVLALGAAAVPMSTWPPSSECQVTSNHYSTGYSSKRSCLLCFKIEAESYLDFFGCNRARKSSSIASQR